MTKVSKVAPKSGDAYRFKYHSTLKGYEKPHYIYIYGCTDEESAKEVFYSELPPGMEIDKIIIDEIRWINKIPTKKSNPSKKKKK